MGRSCVEVEEYEPDVLHFEEGRGRSKLPTFQTYHRVLNRAVWSILGASRILLHLLVAKFAANGPLVVVGINETIERRRGAKLAAAGIYHDPVRSSQSHFVKVNGQG